MSVPSVKVTEEGQARLGCVLTVLAGDMSGEYLDFVLNKILKNPY